MSYCIVSLIGGSGVARASGLDCMFCVGQCTCNKKKKPTVPKVTKPSPQTEVPAPATPSPPPEQEEPPAPKRPAFASIKRVQARSVKTVAAPVLQPEPKSAPELQPTKAATPRPPARPTVPPPTRAARPNLAKVRRVPTDPYEEQVKAAIQVFIDAGFTVERLS